ncbi:leucine zipper putative tumor suppressor 1 [Thalassophryne amazonica]|uniref:leucine zipper putative tumor suppressor 1 n=1 Tax=Thalassophryne amazonica TaxID=390379 RepID=UPI0014713E5A|nr:leucine zipper putative tumor suppressor 1 [Thalassophryne amazonica]XP_034025912.1 leucine zipper putative tumor suppressor 1 [Thalassophryne amazonica]
MGSVSSLISCNNLNSKHCKASVVTLKKEANHHRKTGGCSLDGLLKCGFTQRTSTHPAKGLSHSRSGRSEDFFYIKVSQKPRTVYHRGGPMDDQVEQGSRNEELDRQQQPKLLPLAGNVNARSAADKSLVRSIAFKPVIPRSPSTAETGHNSLDLILSPLEKAKNPDIRHKQDMFSGTLSDSGRNSMSSLPTHSTSGSLSASTGPVTHSDGSSAQANSLSKWLQPNFPLWVNGNKPDSNHRASVNNEELATEVNGDTGALLSADDSILLSETTGGIRAPITTDESFIERLEQRLMERETELQELQVRFEKKEAGTCQLFEEKQRYCTEEMKRLTQQYSTKLSQVSQMAARNQQALQFQISQLQAEKDKLVGDVFKLTQENDLVELRLMSYEQETTQLAPTLEETQWEMCQKIGEISLLKQQLRDCQADVTHKLNEIVSLRTSLKDITAKVEMLEEQKKDHEEKLHSRTAEVEVCQNELQRKKNEADLLREKVGELEKDIKGMKQDLASAAEQKGRHSLQLEAHSQNQLSEHRTQDAGSPSHSQDGLRGGSVSAETLQREVEQLKRQLGDEKDAQKRLADSFEQERQTWNKEKDRVIKYQKQLQIRYLQMHKKNQDLQRIVKELSAELESRTTLGVDSAYNSGLQTYDDVIATEI